MVPSFYLITPILNFKWSSQVKIDLLIFTGWLKQLCSQNFTILTRVTRPTLILTLKTKIWWIMVPSFYLITPLLQFKWSNQVKIDSLIFFGFSKKNRGFTGQLKQRCSQNFTILTLKTKIWWIMVPSFYLITPLLHFKWSSQVKIDSLIFFGLLKQQRSQSFMSLTQETKKNA